MQRIQAGGRRSGVVVGGQMRQSFAMLYFAEGSPTTALSDEQLEAGLVEALDKLGGRNPALDAMRKAAGG